MPMPNDLYADDGGESDDGIILEFEDDTVITRRRPWKLRRIFWRILPVLVLTGVLVAVAEQPDLALLLHRSATDSPVAITVVCDVPWAVIRVDGRGAATGCTSGVAGAMPTARLSVSVGQHTLVATAEGFAPYAIYVVAHPNTPGLYLTQFALTPQGNEQVLDAVNDYFTSSYAQDMTFPASLWQTLGLRVPPSGSSLLVRERFEAVSLDSYEPTYSETTYQRPIVPRAGMLGIAVVVVEHVTIYDGCSGTPLLERRTPVIYATRASVIFSVRPGPQRWTATNPYALNPVADVFTAPNVAATPASPTGLITLAARTELASRLGSSGLLTGGVIVAPLANTSTWAAGVVLTLLNGARQTPRIVGAQPGAVWLYTGGALLALTSPARALSPDIPAATPAMTLDGLRASLAGQSTHVCGGE